MKCKLCNKETDVLVLIKATDHPVCDDCARSIFYQVATAMYKNETIFDVNERKQRKTMVKHPQIAAEVINYLYSELLKKAPKVDPNKLPKGYLELISQRVNDGYTLNEMKAVAYLKFKEWAADDRMSKYLKIDTLYRPKNFDNYLSEVEIKKPKWNVVNSKEQRVLIKELNSYGAQGECNEETDALAKQLMETGYSNKDFLNLYLINKI